MVESPNIENIDVRNRGGSIAMFGNLSLDLLLHIFSFMDLESIVALRKVVWSLNPKPRYHIDKSLLDLQTVLLCHVPTHHLG